MLCFSQCVRWISIAQLLHWVKWVTRLVIKQFAAASILIGSIFEIFNWWIFFGTFAPGQVTDQRPAENTPLPCIWRRNPRCRPSGVSCGRLESHKCVLLKPICKHKSKACSFRQHVLRVHNKNECIIVHVYYLMTSSDVHYTYANPGTSIFSWSLCLS